MNLRAVGWLLGCVLLLLAAFLLVPAAVGAYYAEWKAVRGCLWSTLIAGVVGGGAVLVFRGSRIRDGRPDFFRREGLAVVGLSWLFAGLFGALPFLLSGVISSPIDAFFESTSGITTTGATILSGEAIDRMPRAISFWRSFTHWMGGVGIVLVFVVLLPTGGRNLFRSEVPGISREATQQRVRDSALALVRVYVLLTVIQTICLVLSGLGFFEAVVHAFGTLATAGFSTHSTSIGYYDSWLVEFVIIVFMFVAGINFGIYDIALRSGPRRAWRVIVGSAEIRIYCAMIAIVTLVITVALWLFWGGSNGAQGSTLPDYRSFGLALRDALFTVVSIQTTTGYTTADFDQWPQFCRVLLMSVAFVGACAGSTGGGLKVVRLLIVAKAAMRGIARFARPRAIHPLRLEGEQLDEGVVASVTGYFGLWVLVAIGGTLFVSAFGIDLVSSGTAVLATLNNIGPGLGLVGPAMSFGTLPDAVKVVLTLFMILGRLEFYAVVVMFVPGFWRR